MVLKTNTKILKKCKNIVNKYNKRKRMLSSAGVDLNISVELPEIHIFNKRVQDNKTNTRTMRPRHRNNFKSRNGSKSKLEHIYETIGRKRSNSTLKKMPSDLKVMPLIPFWRSSFEILDNQYSSDKTLINNNDRVPEALYVTMKPRTSFNEPIYV